MSGDEEFKATVKHIASKLNIDSNLVGLDQQQVVGLLSNMYSKLNQSAIQKTQKLKKKLKKYKVLSQDMQNQINSKNQEIDRLQG